jgi:predicted  nucleic acid-binding Zn-ribbon protein
MRKTTVAEPLEMEQSFMAENIFQALRLIQQQLEKEIVSKQKTIERQEEEIRRQRTDLEQKNELVINLNMKLQECQKNAEGNRQLINKLLNDISRVQQDVEWYKRTYESRSLLGTLKQKIFGGARR